jgi:hypothetical protein
MVYINPCWLWSVIIYSSREMIFGPGSMDSSIEIKRWQPAPGVTISPNVTLKTELWNEIQVGSLSPVDSFKKKSVLNHIKNVICWSKFYKVNVTPYKPPSRVNRIIRTHGVCKHSWYSEVLLAGARGFYLSLLERVFHVKILCSPLWFHFRSSLLLVAFITKNNCVQQRLSPDYAFCFPSEDSVCNSVRSFVI